MSQAQIVKKFKKVLEQKQQIFDLKKKKKLGRKYLERLSKYNESKDMEQIINLSDV